MDKNILGDGGHERIKQTQRLNEGMREKYNEKETEPKRERIKANESREK